MFICSSSFFVHGMPSSRGHYEFIACLLQGLYKNADKLRSCLFQDKNANKLRSFLWEPSGRRLANFVRLQASLSRTTKDKPGYPCMPIIDGKQFFSRTMKCYLRQSWAHDSEDSKNNPLVRAHERQADREASLIFGRGHINWLMVGLLALTRQKQLAKTRQATSQPAPASQRWVCLFQDCLFRRNSRSVKTFSEFIVTSKKWDREKQLVKIKFCCTSVYVYRRKRVLNGRFWAMSPKKWYHRSLEIQLGDKF
jgi:hypothetical protein